MVERFKSAIKGLTKFIVFALIFLMLFDFTVNVFREKSASLHLDLIMNNPDNYYDVILAGSSHMQFTLQPAQLFGEHGIVSCNTATAAQSIPTTYYVLKEMIDRHHPKLVVLDLFCLFYPDVYFTPTRFHQSMDFIPLNKHKIEAINDLVPKEDRAEFYLDFLLYHARWKEVTKKDWHPEMFYNEAYQFLNGQTPFLDPFIPVDRNSTAEIPNIPLKYLEKIVNLCKSTDTELLLMVAPYRAEVDNNDTAGTLQQQMYNTSELLAKEWDVDFVNCLYLIDEMGFDFTREMVEFSHVNALGARTVTSYFGKYISENYDIPNRLEDKKYDDWYEDYNAYLELLKIVDEQYPVL